MPVSYHVQSLFNRIINNDKPYYTFIKTIKTLNEEDTKNFIRYVYSQMKGSDFEETVLKLREEMIGDESLLPHNADLSSDESYYDSIMLRREKIENDFSKIQSAIPFLNDFLSSDKQDEKIKLCGIFGYEKISWKNEKQELYKLFTNQINKSNLDHQGDTNIAKLIVSNIVEFSEDEIETVRKDFNNYKNNHLYES